MISVIIATCGDRDWSDLAWARAYPSAARQNCEIVIEHHPDLTVEQARNKAAEAAKRQWLCFLDADDELDAHYIAAMERSIVTSEHKPNRLHAPIVSYVDRTEEGMSLAREPVFPGGGHSMPPMNHCVTGTVVSRLMFRHVGGWRDGYWPWPDYELWLRCISEGATIQYVREAVYIAHVNPASDNQTIDRPTAVGLAGRIHREHRRRQADAARAAQRSRLIQPS